MIKSRKTMDLVRTIIAAVEADKQCTAFGPFIPQGINLDVELTNRTEEATWLSYFANLVNSELRDSKIIATLEHSSNRPNKLALSVTVIK